MTKYNPNIHHRRSIRLKGYDYSQQGLYFITICTQNRLDLFGKINNGKIILNDAGKMIKNIWNKIPNDLPNIRLHDFIVMPNHFHAIIQIVGADSISAQMDNSISAQIDNSISAQIDNSISAPTGTKNRADKRADMESAPTVSLSTVVQSFKRHTTIEYIKMVKQNILRPFKKRVWQRNYWEHIIRNENEYQRISRYIIDNPQKWQQDKFNDGTGNVVTEPDPDYGKEIWMV